MESHIDGNYGALVAADMHFHQTIARAADNALLEDLLQSVRSLIRVWVERALNDSDHIVSPVPSTALSWKYSGPTTPTPRHPP